MLNYINSISPTLPAILFLLKSFLINVKQCENINIEAARIFFLRYKVKVGEFMKLFYACEDIVSKVFLAIEGHQ